MRGIAVYTAMRVALLAGVWLVIQVVTPMRGLLAIAVALVISGVISFIVLDRSRDTASKGLAGVFGRINDRIEQSKVAEDVDDEPADLGQAEAQAQEQSVGEGEQAGGLQDGHEISPGSSADDGAHRADGEDGGDEAEPREGQAEPSR